MTRLDLACALGLLVGTGCCTRHVQLEFPDSSKGAEYSCVPTPGGSITCQPATVVDPAQQNQSHTTFFILPKECRGSFNQITIHDSGSSHPSLDVLCSPVEGKVQ